MSNTWKAGIGVTAASIGATLGCLGYIYIGLIFSITGGVLAGLVKDTK
jgi:hypothetical protein